VGGQVYTPATLSRGERATGVQR